MGEDLYKMMLVAYLHDVGKLLQRAGDIEDKCVLGEGFHEHDGFSCGFIKRYLGEEYEKLFKSSGWKKSDYASASERIRRESTEKVSMTPLLHPAKDREEDGEWWYPVTFLSWSATSGTYFLTNKESARLRINYKNIVKELRRLAEEISAIEDPLSLLETYEYVMRTVGTLIPAAVYMAQPNTSIYGHSRLASSIYPATRTGKYSLFLVDTKGIQRFVTNVKGESEASKRLRGRSFFLQLLQQAMVDRVADILQLSEVNNISFEPGRLIFMVPGRPEEKKKEVEHLLQKISKWSEFELQFTTALSNEKEISKLKFYVEEDESSNNEMRQDERQDKEEGKSNFEEALDQVFKEQRLIVLPSILERSSQDRFGEVTTKWIEVDNENISWLNALAPGEFEVGDKLSIMNLISLIVGHSARNLKAVIEVIEKDWKGGKNESIKKGREGEDEEFAYYSEKGKKDERIRIGKIRIAPLGISFYLIHSPETRDIDVTPIVESLISTLRREKNRVKVFKINDPLNFVFNVSDKRNLTFGYMIVNTFHPIDRDETKQTGIKFKTLDDMGDFIGMGSIDGDEIGTLVKALSRYPSRFMTLSVLMNFVFTFYMVKRIEEISGENPIDVVLLYSGGDDLVVYGRWEDTLKILARLAEGVERILGYITVSGGFTVFKPAYPLYRAYYESREFEDIAKREKKELGKKGGYVAGNVLEPYLDDISGRGVRIYSWEDVMKALDNADMLIKEAEISSGYLYRLHQLGTEIFESVLDNKNPDEKGGNGTSRDRLLSLEIWKARSLVSYAYMNARNPDTFMKASKILGLIPYPANSVNEDEVIRSIVRARTAIQFYSLKSRNAG
jgi:CRISPR-associated protein Csm1